MSDKSYWDNFYSKPQNSTFEWFFDFKEFIKDNELLQHENKKESSDLVLDAGCGTSLFCYHLTEQFESPAYLVCADFSNDALSLLKSKHSELSKKNLSIDYVQCDCKYLPFKKELFDLIVDKGYLDSVLKNENNKDSLVNSLISINSMLEKLKSAPYGYLLQITDEEPETRISLLDEFQESERSLGYHFKEIDIGRGSFYYAYYLFKKKPKA
jgi:SAM-dependent methyltransferase